MTHTEILRRLTEWETAIQAVLDEVGTLERMFDAAPEGPFPTVIHGLIGAYTRTIAEALCWDKDTLEAWYLEHDFGKKPMQAGFTGEAMRTLTTIEELAQFIVDDKERS